MCCPVRSRSSCCWRAVLGGRRCTEGTEYSNDCAAHMGMKALGAPCTVRSVPCGWLAPACAADVQSLWRAWSPSGTRQVPGAVFAVLRMACAVVEQSASSAPEPGSTPAQRSGAGRRILAAAAFVAIVEAAWQAHIRWVPRDTRTSCRAGLLVSKAYREVSCAGAPGSLAARGTALHSLKCRSGVLLSMCANRTGALMHRGSLQDVTLNCTTVHVQVGGAVLRARQEGRRTDAPGHEGRARGRLGGCHPAGRAPGQAQHAAGGRRGLHGPHQVAACACLLSCLYHRSQRLGTTPLHLGCLSGRADRPLGSC